MRVAAVQYKANKADRRASLRALVALSEEAAAGADLVVLPEMAATGYVFPDRAAVEAVAEPADGPTSAALAEVSRRHGVWLVAGFPEVAGDRLFNSALVLDPTGAHRFTYRKTLLFDEDLHWATPGDSGYATFDAGAGTFTVGICMDLNDEGFVDWCRKAAARAIALPTNWIEQDLPVWAYWAWRLGGVPSALVAANTWGAEGDTRFCGRSAVLEGGTVLAHAPAEGDAVIRANLD
ncbi:MAG: carbon-nitrogen hydrolase family protein [Myxococcota bacterium]